MLSQSQISHVKVNKKTTDQEYDSDTTIIDSHCGTPKFCHCRDVYHVETFKL